METVSKEVCELTRKNIEEKLEVHNERLNAHSKENRELTRISDKLTQLVEMQSEQLKAITQEIAELKKEKAQPIAAPKKWYETDIAKFAIKAGIAFVFIVTAAAVGKPFLDAMVQVLQAAPK